MEQMFNVSSNPHVRARMTTAKIMQLVVIALLPAALMGIYNHGLKALAVLVVSTGSAALAEWLYDHFMHKKNTVKDFSAVSQFCIQPIIILLPSGASTVCIA